MNVLKYLIGFLNQFYNCLREREDLRRFIKETQNYPLTLPINSLKKISYAKVKAVCRNYFFQDIDEDISIADNYYYAMNLEDWEKLFRNIWLKPFRWQKEIFDCDDFSIFMLNRVMLYSKLKGLKYQLAFGIGWSYIHSFNVFIWRDGGIYRLYIFEPQTAEIKAPNISKEYVIKKVMFLS